MEIKHIYRQANFVADDLANCAHSLPLGLHIFSSPPASINHIIIHDMYGVAYPRFVLCNALGESHIGKVKEICWVYRG